MRSRSDFPLFLLAVVAACRAPSSKAAAAPRVRSEARATPRALEVWFPRPAAAGLTWPAAGPEAHCEWRFGVRGPGGVTLSSGAARTARAPRRGSARAARAGRGTQPVPGGHALVCAERLAGAGRVEGGRVVVAVRDTALVRLLWARRLPFVWRSVFLPGGRFTTDSVRIEYGPER
jgi:hypothetical protein